MDSPSVDAVLQQLQVTTREVAGRLESDPFDVVALADMDTCLGRTLAYFATTEVNTDAERMELQKMTADVLGLQQHFARRLEMARGRMH